MGYKDYEQWSSNWEDSPNLQCLPPPESEKYLDNFRDLSRMSKLRVSKEWKFSRNVRFADVSHVCLWHCQYTDNLPNRYLPPCWTYFRFFRKLFIMNRFTKNIIIADFFAMQKNNPGSPGVPRKLTEIVISIFQSLALFWHGNLQSYFLFFTMAGVHPDTRPELTEDARDYSCRIFEVGVFFQQSVAHSKAVYDINRSSQHITNSCPSWSVFGHAIM